MASPAHAERHERVKITPINKAGVIAGAKVVLTLRPSSSYQGKSVWIALGSGHRNKMLDPAHRKAATDPKEGYLRHQWPVRTAANAPVEELTLQVMYGEGNALQGGEEVDVLTAWSNGDNGGYWHVYGMSAGAYGDAETPVFKLPGGPAK